MSSDCKICAFKNPRATVTALIRKDDKLLMALRPEDPFKGWWDLIGGYMNENETPEEALRREIKEELGVDCDLKLLNFFPGYASWQGAEYPILSIAYLAELKSEDFKKSDEIEDLKWFPVTELPPIAFDSNVKIINYLKLHLI